MVRMLHIVGSMSPSGIGNFIMNIYRNVDRDKVQFDFIVHERREVSFDEEILRMGGRLYYVTRKSVSPLKNFLEMRRIVKEGGYQVVFRHTDTATVALDLTAAWLGGAAHRIPHSHSTSTSGKRLHRLFRPLLNAVGTEYFACSDKAGEWLYGHDRYEVILNGIDAGQFAYSRDIREQVRREEGLEGRLVIGHVGNFLPVKNHSFLLEVFACIARGRPEAALVLVGDGALRADIGRQAQELGIAESVRLCGVRNDTDRLLQAMDVFLFPSLYEGMPIALVEAQAAGLPCLISDVVTDDVIVTELVEKMPLPGVPPEDWTECARKAMLEKWADRAVKLARETVRTDRRTQIEEGGFCVRRLAERYERLAQAVEGEAGIT